MIVLGILLALLGAFFMKRSNGISLTLFGGLILMLGVALAIMSVTVPV